MGREPVLPVDWVFGLDIENTNTGKSKVNLFSKVTYKVASK